MKPHSRRRRVVELALIALLALVLILFFEVPSKRLRLLLHTVLREAPRGPVGLQVHRDRWRQARGHDLPHTPSRALDSRTRLEVAKCIAALPSCPGCYGPVGARLALEAL
jgi:hypothetical protein